MKKKIAVLLTIVFGNLAKAEKPNIIWLMAEDMGLDLECYGMPGVKTPHLNKLAKEGILYKKAYCTNPICSPNRSAMMIGVHQNITNTHHHRSNRDTPLEAPFRPITSPLREAGYTCLLGHDLVLKKGTKTDCNFKHSATGSWDGVHNFGLFDKRANFTEADQPFFSQIQLAVTHRGDWWNDVRKKSKHPVSVDDVVLPPYFADTPAIRYDWAAYLDTVEFMDNEVGLLMADLKKQGLDQNTIVIFIADNGRCNLRGKGYLQEPGIHVPMIIWGAGIAKAGTVVEELVSTLDISATVLKLAGAQIPHYMTARPILGVEAPKYRDSIRSARDIWDEINDCSRSITTAKYKYIKNHLPATPWATDQAYLELNRPALHIMRRKKKEGSLSAHEMIFFADRKPDEELYDLVNDPDELHNLIADPAYQKILKEMRLKELQWLSKNRDRGLDDLATRQAATDLSSMRARAGIKAQEPQLWERLKQGELMKTQAWMKKYKKWPLPKK